MSSLCQRWRHGEHSWRHRSEGGFDAARYTVGLTEDAAARSFVIRHHYSGTWPAARLRAGLYDERGLVGVAVLAVPVSRPVLTRAFPTLVPYVESLELARFVLLNRVPANAETWFLARAFTLAAQQGVRGVVSFSDPMPRTRLDGGRIVMPGHYGTIYQAANGLHTADRGTARTLLMAPNGRVFSARAMQKVRRDEPGHAYAERQLQTWGASPRMADESGSAWLAHALDEARMRRVRHPGNYRYLFRLGTRAQRSRVLIGLASAPYPKAGAR